MSAVYIGVAQTRKNRALAALFKMLQAAIHNAFDAKKGFMSGLETGVHLNAKGCKFAMHLLTKQVNISIADIDLAIVNENAYKHSDRGQTDGE